MTSDRARPGTPGLVRYVALTGVIATLFGRVLAPALHGADSGIERAIDWTDHAGSFATFLFALVAIGATAAQLFRTSREARLPLGYRVLAVTLGSLVLSFMASALPGHLPERVVVTTAIASGGLALLAAREGLRVPRTRAIATVLGAAAFAALLHLAALLVASYALDHGSYRIGELARAIATGSLACDALAIAVSVAWLGTRSGKLVSPSTVSALAVALLLFWGARRGAGDGAALWQIVANRGVERLLAPPAPYVVVQVRWFFEILAFVLAATTLLVRRQVPEIAGALALVLLARPATDVPLAALALTLAALSTSLAATDDRAIWDVLPRAT